MVRGVKDYWEGREPHVRSVRYIAVLFIFIAIIFVFIIHIILFHPVTDFRLENVRINNSDFVVITAMNNGGLKDEFMEFSVNVTPVSKCRVSYKREGCLEIFNNRIPCKYLEPGEHISLECPLPRNGTTYKITMKSKYQTSRFEFTCSPQSCMEVVSPIYGSYPVVWNYILAYPADRLIDFYNNFRAWLWGEEPES